MLSPTLTVTASHARADGTARLEPASQASTGAQSRSPAGGMEAEYDRCAPLLYRFFAVRLSRDGHAADDLMQQLWLAASRNGAAVPAGECEFWLRGVARNLLATHWRTHARSIAAPVADPALAAELAQALDAAPLPSTLLARREVQHQLLLALTRLNAEDHDLIVAHYWRGVEFAELGRRLGISARAVEGRLYRARAALRDRLNSLDD